MVCKICGLTQTPYTDKGGDGFHPSSDSFVEVTSVQTYDDVHHDAFRCGAVKQEAEEGRMITCYVLVICDLERRTNQVLHFFVLPPGRVPEGGCIDLKVPISEYSYAPYRCRLGELRDRVEETINEAKRNR